MLRFLCILAICFFITACCPPATTNYPVETAFSATVISQENGQTLLRLDKGQTLELEGLGNLEQGQRLYIQGFLSDDGIKVSRVHPL